MTLQLAENENVVTSSPVIQQPKLKYAGIGSRDITEDVWARIVGIASYLRGQGLTCVSGGAEGSDTAFAVGAREELEVWRPQDATRKAREIAEEFHPNWDACDRHAKNLHARNTMILLGEDCETPVEFCVAYTEGGKLKGGTAQGIRIARANRIPVYNIGEFPNEGIFHFRDWYKSLRSFE